MALEESSAICSGLRRLEAAGKLINASELRGLSSPQCVAEQRFRSSSVFAGRSNSTVNALPTSYVDTCSSLTFCGLTRTVVDNNKTGGWEL